MENLNKEQSEKKADTITLTIETPKGVWENAVFEKTAKVQEVIDAVVNKFDFAKDGNYKLKVKGANEFLAPERTLVSYHFAEHTILTFTDIGKGA